MGFSQGIANEMIYKIYSSLPTFKSIELNPGLNLLIAEKSPGASDLQTRNRAGKTSLVEIIHLLSGANIDSLFKVEELSEQSFGMEFDLQESKVTVERSAGKVVLKQIMGDTPSWSFLPPSDLLGERILTNSHWKSILGSQMFDLPPTSIEVDKDVMKFGPTLRSLFGYFVRRQSSGGFYSPFQIHTQQQRYSWQVSISYLLGLDWTIPQKFEFIRDRERSLRELKKAASEGTFGDTIGTTAELRTLLAVAENKYETLKQRVSDFQVLPQYRALEQEAAELTLESNTLSNQNVIDRELIIDLENSLSIELPPSTDDLAKVYDEAGIVLPETALKRFEDVKLFHETVLQNRKSYLGGEIELARSRISSREAEMAQINTRTSQIMGILNSHGALEKLTEMNGELARLEAQTEALRQRFNAAQQMEGLKVELENERNQLLLRLMQDYEEQGDLLARAIVAFEEISGSLYENAGSLRIEPSTNGPSFDISIHGARSKGISNMQIFCFDVMLMQIGMERGIGPRYLVHDSHLFDGVDERQVVNALQVGAKAAEELGFQYIVTLNSDQLPIDSNDRHGLDKFYLPVRLTDASEDGGLFGIRFE